MKRYFIYLLLVQLFSYTIYAQEERPDYSKGIFVLNEDWYGHSNSSLNFLSAEGKWYYNVYQKENPGYELGCTSQFGAIHEGKLYIISKQATDPGASTQGGGRLIVCDAKTIKRIHSLETISVNQSGESNADGRAFLGINAKKAYVSTSNGIYIYDIERMEIRGKIDGSGNPEDSGYGSLYRGQTGNMVLANGTVYAVHQSAGVLIINSENDQVIRAIQAPNEMHSGKMTQRGFGSIVRSKDGFLWLSVAENSSGSGSTAPYLLRLDPTTNDTLRIKIPTGIYSPSNSWYAWTSDGFCAGQQKNRLYWTGGENSWFSGQTLFRYDIDRGEFSKILDLKSTPWKMYGAAFRMDPKTDDLYCYYYRDFMDPTYKLVRLSDEGSQLAEYPMIDHYWFPALAIFPPADEQTGVIPFSTLGLQLYPNPMDDYLYLKQKEGLIGDLQIVDAMGRVVYSAIVNRSDWNVEVRSWPQGLYIVKVGVGDQKMEYKLIKR